MSYIERIIQGPPPPEPLPAFKRGGMHTLGQRTFAQSAASGGETFRTDEPFEVGDYAIFAGLSVVRAQAVLDQAVIDGNAAAV
ncbi:MAG: hypothetical protein JWM06_1684 [Actinomycetia bacterium]|nr:hypothetical protein [Actinomycetes bacterium]